MSEEMAMNESATGEDHKLHVDEAADASAVGAADTGSEIQKELINQPQEGISCLTESAPEPELMELLQPKEEPAQGMDDCKQNIDTDYKCDPDTSDKHGIKRRASIAFSDEDKEEFKGFQEKLNETTANYAHILERIEAEVQSARENFTPVRLVTALSPSVRPSKRPRQDTDGSRPSSALSTRSGEDVIPSSDVSSSPAGRGRRANTEMASPQYRVPLERGWKRELVYRAALDAHSRRNADIYYYMPHGKKLRSMREISENLSGTGLTLDNFTFFKEPLGTDDPEKEIIRDAKMMRRVDSPVSSPAPTTPTVEVKRTPKPKPPKGVSPEPPTVKSPPVKLRVKSVGSRLSGNGPAGSPKVAKKTPASTAPVDNNNTSSWKKPSENKRGRLANGAASPTSNALGAPGNVGVELTSPTARRRGRPKANDTDYFTAFYQKADKNSYNVAVQIFQYLGMRDLAHSARVCKLWQKLTATPALWRHVRMKNSHVSDWGGLCAALKKHGTKRLDLRKMLLPQNDNVFWDQFAEHIGSVDTLERIEMCRCPARAVEAVCRGVRGLRALCALAIRDALLDPAPLAALPLLQDLRLKSMSGFSLARDLTPLHRLTNLHHLSLTSIKELGWCACDVVGQLPQLESLELGECTFRAEFAATLSKLTRLRRLRLERGTAQCAAPALLRALAALPLLTRLELVNIDIKTGFDDALAECKNIQRLLIIPTYVSQSATTNKQVLSGVLRLKDTLTHLMWGVTIELLRVTELFIDQCEQGGESKKKDIGECIPVLKPVPGCKLPDEHLHVNSPPQVEILPLPTLQRLLSAQLPNTKLKLLRIPFHATWRQSLADFQ